ncbi:MAG: hypothetical protein V3R16_02490 [Nitrospirales bacterium]
MGSPGDVERLAMLVASRPKMRPPGLDSWEEVLIVMRAGMEAGLNPIRAVQSLYVSQGRVNWYVKNAWGVVCSKTTFLGDPDKWIECSGVRMENIAGLKPEQTERMVGCFQTHRQSWQKPKITRYTVSQAKAQGLWGKKTPGGKPTAWITAPDRMLLARAESRHLDDWYSDILMGLSTGDVGPLAEVRESPADFEPEVLPPPPPKGDPLLDQLEAGLQTVDTSPTKPEEVPAEPAREEPPPPQDPDGGAPPDPADQVHPDESIPKGLGADQLKAAGFLLCPHCERTLNLIADVGHGEPCK